MQFTKTAILAFASMAFAAPLENEYAGEKVVVDQVLLGLPSGCTGGVSGPGPLHDCLVGLSQAGVGCASAIIMGGADPIADIACIAKAVTQAKNIKACGKCIPKL